jgi:hypothetical protein
MPPRLADHTQRINIVATAALIKRIDDWRRQQDKLPTLSDALRRILEVGLDTLEAASKKAGKPGR